VALKAPVRHPGLRIKTNGDFTIVDLTVQPVPAGPDSDVAAKLFLVVFEDAPAPVPQLSETAAALGGGGETGEVARDVDARVATLKQELRAKEEYRLSPREVSSLQVDFHGRLPIHKQPFLEQ
jgi:two-component system, chemotaxis family, CheB/CheR fusion protein